MENRIWGGGTGYPQWWGPVPPPLWLFYYHTHTHTHTHTHFSTKVSHLWSNCVFGSSLLSPIFPPFLINNPTNTHTTLWENHLWLPTTDSEIYNTTPRRPHTVDLVDWVYIPILVTSQHPPINTHCLSTSQFCASLPVCKCPKSLRSVNN